jgi:hypothetical protein
MIEDSRHLKFFKEVAIANFVAMVNEDYGSAELLIHLADSISEIYKHLQYNRFNSVTIYVAVDDVCSLSSILGANPNSINSYENLSPISGNNLVIEVKENGSLQCSVDFDFDINSARQNAIIYQFIKSTETEIIFGKNSENKLLSIPDADSYFAIQTYKELDLALEDYGTKIAKHSECVYLKSTWFDDGRIFFKPKPEHTLRDSLTQFLKMRLRNVEVRPEQIVDDSHPVDIKVTWSLANHLALIEIKWIGKSLENLGEGFKSEYYDQRALDGAKQLADYLDANIKQAPVKTTKGYLVIFDARRWQCNNNTTSVNAANGLHYVNSDIAFNPEYHNTRNDFAKPIRFFLEPVITN